MERRGRYLSVLDWGEVIKVRRCPIHNGERQVSRGYLEVPYLTCIR